MLILRVSGKMREVLWRERGREDGKLQTRENALVMLK
jgi:hypothetical protein